MSAMGYATFVCTKCSRGLGGYVVWSHITYPTCVSCGEPMEARGPTVIVQPLREPG